MPMRPPPLGRLPPQVPTGEESHEQSESNTASSTTPGDSPQIDPREHRQISQENETDQEAPAKDHPTAATGGPAPDPSMKGSQCDNEEDFLEEDED